MALSEIRLDGVKLVEKFLSSSKDQVDRAARVAVSTTVTSTEEKIERNIIRQHNLPSSFKGKRAYSSVRGLKGNVWIGGYPVKASVLGRLKQTNRGARAGRHFFKGAFVSTLRSGHVAAFRRKQTATKWTPGRPRTSSPNLGIDEVAVELTKLDRIVNRQRIEAEKRLERIFIREMQAFERGTVLQ